jgi:chorismate synthase
MIAILEGMVSGLRLERDKLNIRLKRRMQGYGRGERMKLEDDSVKILSGLRRGLTIGSPIALLVENRDFSIETLPAVSAPRPGHADLAGALKYNCRADVRNVLERASARETVGRVCVGEVCRIMLAEFNVKILSHVVEIGGIEAHTKDLSFEEIERLAENSPLRCADEAAAKLMCEEIDKAREEGNTVGGAFEIVIKGVPPGIGSYVHWDRKLDSRLAGGLMSIQGIKAVGIGAGCGACGKRGSEFHDEIFWSQKEGFVRKTNNAGGIEGGVSNGEEIVVRCYMKPIATLKRPLMSVDIKTKKAKKADIHRSDICAVAAAGVIGEAVAAFEVASLFCEKFGGDSLGEMKRNFENYLKQLGEF